jgi:hypothetical protein
MPMVGKKKFAYTPSGQKAAMAASKKSGQKVTMKAAKKSK